MWNRLRVHHYPLAVVPYPILELAG
jgi:hypothetical protein